MARSSCVIRIQMCLPSWFAAFVLGLTAGGALNAQTPAQETVSIIHVTVVDVASGKKLPAQIVVLESDLVLLAADPLADIHNTTRIQAVWLRGKYFDRAALDHLLVDAKHGSGKSKLP